MKLINWNFLVQYLNINKLIYTIKMISTHHKTPIKRKNLDTFYCIKISNLIWQRYTILIQLHTLSLVIVKLLGLSLNCCVLHTPIG